LYRRTAKTTYILKKRLALFHPLNLDNSPNIGIVRNALPAMDCIPMYIYRQGCELFFYIHIQAVQSQTESIVLIGSHFFVCINLKQWKKPVIEPMQGENEMKLYGTIRHT